MNSRRVDARLGYLKRNKHIKTYIYHIRRHDARLNHDAIRDAITDSIKPRTKARTKGLQNEYMEHKPCKRSMRFKLKILPKAVANFINNTLAFLIWTTHYEIFPLIFT